MIVQTHLIGCRKADLDTPALLVDLPTLERNTRKMADTIIRKAGVQWRPHTKGMKTPALAHRLLEAGAIGITCAKLGEAEVMAAGGINDILIANQIVGPRKIARLVNLRKQADVMVCVDNESNVRQLSLAAAEKGVRVRVLIEVDVGMNRAGVAPGGAVLSLARTIAACPGLELSGLMTWEAHTLAIKDPCEKRRIITESLSKLTDSADLCRRSGIRVDILSCGGTGTYWISAFHPGVTEIEAGGGIFGDIRYRTVFGVQHEYALTVLSTVTSRPAPTRIICDAGKKTMSSDSSVPAPIGIPNVTLVSLSAEHGKIELGAPAETPGVGETIEFVAGYSDTTVVLHDELYGIRDGVVEAVWPLPARGRLQ